MWLDPAQNKDNIQWTRDFFQEVRKHSKGQVYFNFNGDISVSSEVLQDSFGPNYDRLVDIKTKYDPDNLFRLNANIKPRT